MNCAVGILFGVSSILFWVLFFVCLSAIRSVKDRIIDKYKIEWNSQLHDFLFWGMEKGTTYGALVILFIIANLMFVISLFYSFILAFVVLVLFISLLVLIALSIIAKKFLTTYLEKQFPPQPWDE